MRMGTLAIVQRCIAIAGVLLVSSLNLLPELFYVGMHHPVGTDAVRMYKYDSRIEDPTVPVYEFGGDGSMADTGERVRVYLRNDYRDAHLLAKPNLTLLLIGASTILYLLAGVFARRRSKLTTAP